MKSRFCKPYHPFDWPAWREHLATRKTPAAPWRLPLNQTTWPLLWASVANTEETENKVHTDRITRLARFVKSKPTTRLTPTHRAICEEVETWLEQQSSFSVIENHGNKGNAPPIGLASHFAIECLAWCYALPRLAAILPEASWWTLCQMLVNTARDAAALTLNDAPLTHQLLAGELPLTLAYFLPELKSAKESHRMARAAFSEGLRELPDGEGMLHCKHLPWLRPLLACWTRATMLDNVTLSTEMANGGEERKERAFDPNAQLQYEWVVRQAIRMTRADGTQILSNNTTGAWCKSLFDAAIWFAGDPIDIALANQVLPKQKSSAANGLAPPNDDDFELPTPAYQSEWAGVSLLRPDWKRKGIRLAITFGHGKKITTELDCGRDIVWQGEWTPEVSVDGHPIKPTSDWEEICWTTDEDGDFLELQIDLEGGWRIQRQVFLPRKDRFLFLADAIYGEQVGQIDYRSQIPLAHTMTYQPAKESWEGFLTSGRKQRGLVMPLALPEWRCDTNPTTGVTGSLAMEKNGLTLTQSATAQRLYAPLLIDLDPKRIGQMYTWRQLTIAEQLEVQPAEVAVGYRAQVGQSQWLLYRSLAPRGNRTVLGHNLSSEFLIAQFDCGGEVTPLLEIE